MTLEEVAEAMGGRILGEITVPTVSGVSTDSRNLSAGSLFFAIVGQTFDGHAFVGEVLERGAGAAVVSDPTQVHIKYQDCGRLIRVADTTEALGKLAAWYRRQFAATVIGVVGSNGKTTTKDMIATVLASRKRGRAAPASFNNAIGVPLTLLSVEPSDEFVVVEIGTNHPGEVAALGRLAQPDLGVVTSIGEEHLQSFGDVESVATEEFSLLPAMRGRAFVAVSDQAARYAPAGAGDHCTMLTYGTEERADLRAGDFVTKQGGLRFKVNGRFQYRLGVPGRHNAVNALAAIAIGTRMRLTHEDMAAALLKVRLPPMRTERLVVNGITLINDAYNANPSSMRAAFDVMDHLEDVGRRVFVLGDMRELGSQAAACHQAVGREAGRSTAHVIIAVGAYARVVADGATSTAGMTKRIYSLPTVEAASERIGTLLEAGDVVLLKASRAVRLERLVEALRQAGRARTRRHACKPGPPTGR
ncbi:MAG: UDP-N-acetylmuramoyl-tripeptide--D-alanyl-D-alanine ligase [Phycisphaerae bacterium]|nr:UDP-N-acetylmuramoyl-tripeptide--D-alanyl-D-alanine ligase [Phycisphaerae bacterium]